MRGGHLSRIHIPNLRLAIPIFISIPKRMRRRFGRSADGVGGSMKGARGASKEYSGMEHYRSKTTKIGFGRASTESGGILVRR